MTRESLVNYKAALLARRSMYAIRAAGSAKEQAIVLRALLDRLGRHAKSVFGAAVNGGMGTEQALRLTYARLATGSGLGRWRQDWGGLRGLGNENVSSGGAGSGGEGEIDWSDPSGGVTYPEEGGKSGGTSTETPGGSDPFGFLDSLIDGITDVVSSGRDIMDSFGGGDTAGEQKVVMEQEAAPGVTVKTGTGTTAQLSLEQAIGAERAAQLQSMYQTAQVRAQAQGAAPTGIFSGLTSLPSYALVIGAGLAAGVGVYLYKKFKKGKK